MTLPSGLFRRDVGQVARRYPFVWRARDLSLTALTGQIGTLTRTTTKAVTDSQGVSRTVNHSQPAWDGSTTLPSLVLGAAETLKFPFAAPPIAMSGLIDFYENGTLAAGAAVGAICNATPVTPFIVIFSSTAQYQIQHHNGTTSVTSILSGTAPTAGQRVQLRWWLYSDGKVQIWQSINGAAETAATVTGSLTLAGAWSSPTFYWINGEGAANIGSCKSIASVVMLGNQTQAKLLEALA